MKPHQGDVGNFHTVVSLVDPAFVRRFRLRVADNHDLQRLE